MDSNSATKRCAAHSRRSCEDDEMACDNPSRAVRGWLAGCGAATAFFGAMALVGSAIASGGDIIRFFGVSIGAIFPLFLFFLFTCLLTGIPAAIVIWVSAKLGIRSILFFGGIGALMGGLIPGLLLGISAAGLLAGGWLFLVAGFAAGVAYWHVAGKYTGG